MGHSRNRYSHELAAMLRAEEERRQLTNALVSIDKEDPDYDGLTQRLQDVQRWLENWPDCLRSTRRCY